MIDFPTSAASATATERDTYPTIVTPSASIAATWVPVIVRRSTFGRDAVDRFLVDRIHDSGEVERLGHKIFTEDTSLVLQSGNVDVGVWTTKEMLAIEGEVADLTPRARHARR